MSNFAEIMKAAGVDSPEDMGLTSFDELDDETIVLEGEEVDDGKVALDPVKVKHSVEVSATFFSNAII